MIQFRNQAWAERFAEFGWSEFGVLWDFNAKEVEEPNIRRGGWSGVVKVQAPDGSAYYLKRQENHDFADPASGFRKRPTVVREWKMSNVLDSLGIGVAAGICLGVESREGSSRGLLMTQALDNHTDLSSVLRDPALTAENRFELWQSIAKSIRRLHDRRYRHNCLYGQHILVQFEPENPDHWDIRFIDLEKLKRVRSFNRAAIGDLSQLVRHTDDMSNRDKYSFWDSYFSDFPISKKARLLMKIEARSSKRIVKQYIDDRRVQITG